jgi:hypothetical protein
MTEYDITEPASLTPTSAAPASPSTGPREQDRERVPIYHYLDLSTAHLTEAECEALTYSRSQAAPRCIDHEYGYWVHVPAAEDDEAGEERAVEYPNLQAVIEYARRHQCNWINFDVDAAIVATLSTFDW